MYVEIFSRKDRLGPPRLSVTCPLYTSLTLLCASMLSGCPSDPPGATGAAEPKITISPALPCVEPILPVFDSSTDEAPVIGTLEVSVTGISAGDSNGLEVKLFYEDQRIVGCFLSTVDGGEGSSAYRCNTLESASLSLSARRAYDSLYCLSGGRMELFAEVSLADGTYKRSEPVEVVCTDPSSFEASCTPVGSGVEDMGFDMGLDEGVVGPDMGPVDTPTQWSISYSSPESPTQLSVQGSSNAAPNVGRYSFRVVNQSDEPLSGVPVRFFLNWSALDDYPLCELPCAQERSAAACDARDACEWDLTLPSSSDDVERGGDDGSGGEAMGGEDGEAGAAPQPSIGSCRVSDSWGGDERCARDDERCEANICLPSRNPGAVGPLPVAIDPLNTYTDQDGLASVSMVAQREPGVFSIRAEAEIGGRAQVANTPNITVLHEIATQGSLSLSCTPSIVNSFSTREAPSELSTEMSSYQLYQFEEPLALCTLQLGDRFSGPISGSSVFFLSESGTITQSSATDETGRAVGALISSAPTPTDVDPISYSAPYVDYSGDRACQAEESLTGSCEDVLERSRTLSWQFGPAGSPRSMTLNPRDGLTRVVGFTQGEAPFVDYILDGNDPLASVVGLYQPEFDFVPLHSEPFVDANDNQVWDIGERFFDANRNGAWDLDVFGRAERADELRCAHTNLRAISAVSGEREALLTDCIPTNPPSADPTLFDLDDLISSLADDNPPNLNAYIWTSSQILNVGLPVIGTFEDTLSVECLNGECVKASEYNNNFPCGPLPNGAQVALNATNASAYVQLRLSLTDAHLNCLGLTGVSYSVTGEGLTEGGVSGLDPLRDAPLPWGSYSPSYNQCFSAVLSGVPLSQTLVTGASAAYTPPQNPEPPYNTSWRSGHVLISVQVPDHRVTVGGTLKYDLRVQAAICVND